LATEDGSDPELDGPRSLEGGKDGFTGISSSAMASTSLVIGLE